MGEQEKRADEAELKQPEEAIKDLEPDEAASEAVSGGAIDSYMEFKIKGE